jgi:hypothetical protein
MVRSLFSYLLLIPVAFLPMGARSAPLQGPDPIISRVLHVASIQHE